MSLLKLYTGTKSDKDALLEWEEILETVRKKNTAKKFNSAKERADYIKWIEKPGNQEVWMAEMFSQYCTSKPAKFQIKSTRRLMGKKRYRQARRWARGLSKSTRRMMEILYKHFVEGFRVNMLLISKNESNAERLLEPYRAQLEANPRLIDIYGTQVRPGKWTSTEFVTKRGASFRAVGAGQNPRGARLEELRVTILLFDDLDDDEVVLNTDRLNKIWDWLQKAVLPTIDIAGDYLIFFDNNPIAEDCLVNRFAALTEDNEIIPIITDDGKSTWPEKNSLEDIADIRKNMSDYAFQGEYLCNPIRLGKTFEKVNWGKCPPLSKLPFVVVYADPATSNKDKPTGKSKAANSCKGAILLGYLEGKFYVYTCRLDHMNNNDFITGIYDLNDYVQGKTAIYNLIENNTLQDPFYEQVLKPAIIRVAKELMRAIISIIGDDRKKPEKFFRIEAELQPLMKNGELIFNEDEKANPHMQRLEEQFLAASPNSKTMDGPDFVEGGVWYIKNKLSITIAGLSNMIKQFARPVNKKRM